MVFSRLSNLPKILIAAVVLISLLPAPNAFASVYGSGTYNKCAYGNGCPATGGRSPSEPGNISTPANSQPSDQILLNDFTEYFGELGKRLYLQTNQVVYFDITAGQTTKRHNITVKEVGSSYVVIVLASDPIDAKLVVSDIRQFDVNGDDVADIQISLANISDSVATMIFKNLGVSSPSVAPPSSSLQQISTKNRLSLIIYATFLATGLLIFALLFWKRRKKRRENQT